MLTVSKYTLTKAQIARKPNAMNIVDMSRVR
jgi:hypothetical protein